MEQQTEDINIYVEVPTVPIKEEEEPQFESYLELSFGIALTAIIGVIAKLWMRKRRHEKKT